jgi:hypothetical protein
VLKGSLFLGNKLVWWVPIREVRSVSGLSRTALLVDRFEVRPAERIFEAEVKELARLKWIGAGKGISGDSQPALGWRRSNGVANTP